VNRHLLQLAAGVCAACGLADAGTAADGGAGVTDAHETETVIASGDAAGGCGAGTVWAGSSGYCIDAAEVTNADYTAFLSALAKGSAVDQPPECAFNTSFVPDRDWPYATGLERVPVVWVNWCDAFAYCKWMGKRLCGLIGGGPSPVDGAADAKQSQWFSACSANGTFLFPYGPTYQPTACYANQPQGFAPSPVATHPGCWGGYLGIFDMSGNAWEWEDSCMKYTGNGSDDLCLIRGGGVSSTEPGLGCDSKVLVARKGTTGDRGFRCCSP
jgi:sulfatase modifying factor 1